MSAGSRAPDRRDLGALQVARLSLYTALKVDEKLIATLDREVGYGGAIVPAEVNA